MKKDMKNIWSVKEFYNKFYIHRLVKSFQFRETLIFRLKI